MNKSYVKNASDPKQVKKGEQKEKARRDQELNDIRIVLNTPQGRRFLWRLTGKCGLYETSFTGNSETFFREGMRNIGLFLTEEMIESDQNAYLTMQKEAMDVEDKIVEPNGKAD